MFNRKRQRLMQNVFNCREYEKSAAAKTIAAYSALYEHMGFTPEQIKKMLK